MCRGCDIYLFVVGVHCLYLHQPDSCRYVHRSVCDLLRFQVVANGILKVRRPMDPLKSLVVWIFLTEREVGG